MSEPKIRFGLIGYGAWGRHHAHAIATCADAELVAIAGHSPVSIAEARQAYPHARVTGDYHQLLAEESLDCVAVVVPSHLHFEIASAVLASGRHLLLEKPMALTLPDCDALIALAAQKKRLFAVGHELRLSSLWGLVKQKIEQGFIGRPLYALVELSRNPYRQGSTGWRYDISRVGNWILEEPIHFFDLACWYLADCGQPSSIFATASSSQADHPELQDNFSAIMNMSGGAYAVITQSLCAFEHHQTVKITGTEGALWAAWSGAMDRTRHPTFSLRAFDGQQVTSLPIAKMTGELFELEEQVQRMVDSIRGQQSLHCTAEDGRQSVRLCLAAQQSVDSGCPVKLSEGQ